MATILAIAVLMTMTGRGGGNFYVLALVLSGLAMKQAATTGQFILMFTALAGMLIFQKNRLIDWKLALIIEPPTSIMAFFGGYLSDYIDGPNLKLFFAVLLFIAGILMLIKIKERPRDRDKKIGYWHRKFHGQSYIVNLWTVIPITAMVGLASGALGISGGSFKVPLMILLCGVPMRIAVGTSSAMVAVTALMGFMGHASRGHFEPGIAIPLAAAAVIGGLIGSKFALKTKTKNLKKIFAYTTMAASIFMLVNSLMN